MIWQAFQNSEKINAAFTPTSPNRNNFNMPSQQKQKPGKTTAKIKHNTSEPALWKKILFSALATLAFFFALELALWAGGVALLVDREDPFRGFSGLITVFEPQGNVYRTRLPKPGGTFNDQSFQTAKPANGVRLFTLGGSSSYGFPWSAPVAFTAILGDVLAAAHPQRTIEAVNASGVSYAMHRLNLVADELFRYEPDIFIIYSGHNEFIEPEFFNALKRRSSARNQAEYLLAHSRVYSGMHALLNTRNDQPATLDAKFDERVRRENTRSYLPAEKEAIVEEFRWRLQRLVRRAHERGIKVVVCTVPCNLRDWRPELSLINSALDEAGRRQWEQALRSGEARLARREYADALVDFQRAAELSPHHAMTHYFMAQCHEGLAQWQEAQQAYQRACDEDASPSRRLSKINQAIREVAEEEGALLVDMDQIFAAQSPRGLVGFNLIEDYVHPTPTGHQEIAWHLWQALERAGWIGETATMQREQFDAIVKQRATPDSQANPSWLFNQGVILATQGRDDLAMEKFRQALELEPTHGGALGNLVSLLLKQGKIDQAFPLAEKLVELYPDYPNFQTYLALILASKQELTRAKVHFENVLRLRAGDPVAHNQLGLISEQQGDEIAAAKHYEQALASYGAFAEARYNLGKLRFTQGRYAEAQAYFEQALASQPDYLAALLYLGMAQQELGNDLAAQAQYEKALAIAPDHVDVLNNLAWLLAISNDRQIRNPAEALRLARQAAELTQYKGYRVLGTLAAAAAATGDFAEAVKWQTRAVELAPAGEAATLKARLKRYQSGQSLQNETPD
ncbi:tetratricopeptide repeat protein [Cytophagia bacterium CHB2]|nr:tetratricopeptide repeat protein [Cytophagia bacterium CHB2]